MSYFLVDIVIGIHASSDRYVIDGSRIGDIRSLSFFSFYFSVVYIVCMLVDLTENLHVSCEAILVSLTISVGILPVVRCTCERQCFRAWRWYERGQDIKAAAETASSQSKAPLT